MIPRPSNNTALFSLVLGLALVLSTGCGKQKTPSPTETRRPDISTDEGKKKEVARLLTEQYEKETYLKEKKYLPRKKRAEIKGEISYLDRQADVLVKQLTDGDDKKVPTLLAEIAEKYISHPALQARISQFVTLPDMLTKTTEKLEKLNRTMAAFQHTLIRLAFVAIEVAQTSFQKKNIGQTDPPRHAKSISELAQEGFLKGDLATGLYRDHRLIIDLIIDKKGHTTYRIYALPVDKTKKLSAYMRDVDGTMRYTRDGSQPTSKSPVIPKQQKPTSKQ